MRVEHNADDTAKVWISQDEYQRLLSVADEYGDNWTIPIRLGAECGLRHAESAAVTPGDLSEVVVDFSNNDLLRADVDVDGRTVVHWLTVVGKDTTGGDGKRRDAFVPNDVYRDLELEKHRRDLDGDDEFVLVSPRSVRRWIDDISELMADENGKPEREYLSSHDLRRYFATTCLQVAGMNPEVVKEVGGWNSYKAMKPYLQSPVQEVIAAEFAAAGML